MAITGNDQILRCDRRYKLMAIGPARVGELNKQHHNSKKKDSAHAGIMHDHTCPEDEDGMKNLLGGVLIQGQQSVFYEKRGPY